MRQTQRSRSHVDRAAEDRALDALASTRNISTPAIRLLLRASALITLGTALALGRWRDARDPATGAFAEHCQAELKNDEQRETLDIIRGRILRMPAAERKRYTPEERFRIVVHTRTYGLSHEEAAERFMVDAGTVGRWVRDATREPDKETVGSLLKPTPPVHTVDDVTRELVALLDRMRVGGSKRIAQLLTRAGRKIGTESVRRIRNSPPVITPPNEPPSRSVHSHALRANTPNHVWMTDITSVPSLFRLWTFKLVVVLDVLSRYPLALRIFPSEPSSDEIAALVRECADRFGPPRHFVTDRGSQFTGEAFVSTLRDLGVAHRFGAIGKSGSIAIIERFWRTLKEMIDSRFMPPLSLRHLHDKVDRALFYYATLRPHQGLGGATPTEIYFGLTPAIVNPTPEPERLKARGLATSEELPFEIAYLDPERRLPFLVPARRAA
ncbi:MAG: DDE-type integrase/transposase/recombinase [Thermoanaerobaculia bacterium]